MDLVRRLGGRCDYTTVESPHGHDGFLLETAAVGAALGEFIEEGGKR